MHTVNIRFYAELNDFLPKRKRQVKFTYSFYGSPSVKDVIEAEGIPHTEVDLILANGISVDFSYCIKQDDDISVYPVFETLDISPLTHLIDRPLRESRFVLDVHLGKLAKYLRMLGFDTLYRNDYKDKELADISLSQNRIILTRDRDLLKYSHITHGYYVRNTNSLQQVSEIVKRFDLYEQIKPLSRCILCNHPLSIVDKAEIIDQLEPKTIKHYNTFYRCEGCGKIYWKGSHYKRMKGFVSRIRENA